MEIVSLIAGTVVEVGVSAGQLIRAGDEVALVESMKMEIPVTSPVDGVVEGILVAPGDAVSEGTPLVLLVIPG